MAFSVTFKDETLTGKLIQEISVPVGSEVMTLREIIMLRVEEEIRRREDEKHQRFMALAFEMDERERTLNGVRESANPEKCLIRRLMDTGRSRLFSRTPILFWWTIYRWKIWRRRSE